MLLNSIIFLNRKKDTHCGNFILNLWIFVQSIDTKVFIIYLFQNCVRKIYYVCIIKLFLNGIQQRKNIYVLIKNKS